MDNSKIDYTLQYSNWHWDSTESKANDIKFFKDFFDRHSLLPANKSAKILDIGCSFGRLMLALKECGYSNVIGVDIDAKQIEIAKKDMLNVYNADAISFLENSTDTYDVVFCIDLLEHLDKAKQIEFLKAIKSRMNKNAYMVIQVPNALSILSMYYRYLDFTHELSYTDESLRFVCKNAGYNFIQVRPDRIENIDVRILKSGYAKLLKIECNIDKPILTPNIVGIVFLDEGDWASYAAKSSVMLNNYNIPSIDSLIISKNKIFFLYYLYRALYKISSGEKKTKFKEKYDKQKSLVDLIRTVKNCKL